MAAKRKAQLFFVLLAFVVSSQAFASIPRPDYPLQPQSVDRYAILETIESSSADTTPSLHRAIENALPAPRPVATLSESRVWGSDFLKPFTRPEVTPLSRALHRASARLWPDVASDRTVLSPDPLGYRDSSNLYAFAGGDPVNGRDPSGMGGPLEANWLAHQGKKSGTAVDALREMLQFGKDFIHYDQVKDAFGGWSVASPRERAMAVGVGGIAFLDLASNFIAPGEGTAVQSMERAATKEIVEVAAEQGAKEVVTAFAGREAGAISNPRRLLPAAGETTKTIEEVQRLRGTGRERGLAFNEYLAQLNKGRQEVSAETRLGRRFHDVGDIPGMRTQLRIEGKNYRRFLTVNGEVVKGSVPLTGEIRKQIYKDVLFVREGRRQGVERLVQWEFGGAGPSEELAAFLQRWRIPYVQH